MKDREHRGPKIRYILVPYPRTPRVYGYEEWNNGCRAGVLVPVGHSARYAQDVTDDLLREAKRNGTVNTSHPGFDWGRNLDDFPDVYWGTRTDPQTGQEVDATTHRRIILKDGRAGNGILFHHILRERGIETVS